MFTSREHDLIIKVCGDIQDEPQSQNIAYQPSGHMTLIQRRLNVDATSWRCIDVEPTLYKRQVPAGNDTKRKSKYTMTESTQTTKERKVKKLAPLPQQDGHNDRQDPLNTTIRQRTGQNTKSSEQPKDRTKNKHHQDHQFISLTRSDVSRPVCTH